MSKSLGNTLTIRDLVERHDPEAMRLYLLGTHYRTRSSSARSASPRQRAALGAAARARDGGGADRRRAARRARPRRRRCSTRSPAHRARFEAAMDDDFNTPQALGVLFDLARALHAARDQVTQGAAEPAPSCWGWASW